MTKFNETYLCVDLDLFSVMMLKIRSVFKSDLPINGKQAAFIKATFMKNVLWICCNALADNSSIRKAFCKSHMMLVFYSVHYSNSLHLKQLFKVRGSPFTPYEEAQAQQLTEQILKEQCHFIATLLELPHAKESLFECHAKGFQFFKGVLEALVGILEGLPNELKVQNLAVKSFKKLLLMDE